MEIKTKSDWIALAKAMIPRLPVYMMEFSGNVDPVKVESELGSLIAAENWTKLHQRFEEIHAWLPDSPSIRHHPFFNLCDLCSESWVLYEETKS